MTPGEKIRTQPYRAKDIRRGDRVQMHDGSFVTVTAEPTPGSIRGLIRIEHDRGWGELRPDDMLELQRACLECSAPVGDPHDYRCSEAV